MDENVLKRVLQAINLIENQNMGVDGAAKSVGTDRRTVYRYLQNQGQRIVRSGAGKAFKIGIEDIPKQSPAVIGRVKKALALMERRGIGIDRAAKMVGTDRRTVYRYLQREGIRIVRKGPRGQVFIRRMPLQKKIDFIWAMSKGKSASAASRELKTTVRTMSKVKHDGVNIIKKVKGRWKSQFLPIYTHRLVVYGTMTGFNGNTLGRNQVSPNKATDKNLDKEYAEIWWQIDFDKFKSTLDSLDVGKCHAPRIFQMLKDRLETPSLTNATLVTSFNTDPRIAQDITSTGRGTTPANTLISPLENIFQRYDLQFDDDYNWGVDDNMSPRPVGLLPIKDAPKKYFQPIGKFQIIVLRKGYAEYYPTTPLKIPYRVNVKYEEECR